MSNTCTLCLNDNAEITAAPFRKGHFICEDCKNLAEEFGHAGVILLRLLQRIERLENEKEYKIVLEDK